MLNNLLTDEDMLTNLLAELFGIVVTVVVIDRLIARRENKRWRPATNFFFFELFIITKKLMDTLAPRENFRGKVCKYRFGDRLHPIKAVPSEEFAKGRLENIKTIEFVNPATRVIDQRPRFLSEYRQRLSNLLSQSQGVLAREPKLVELVSELYEQLRYVADTVDEQRSSADASYAMKGDQDLVPDFEKVARQACRVRLWLEKKASSVEPIEQEKDRDQ